MLLWIMLFGLQITYGQIGYQINMERHSYIESQQPSGTSNNLNIHSLGAQVGTQYWFRLKNKRIEFIPGIHVAADIGQKTSFQKYKIVNIQAMATFPILIYPLSFTDDCNCPTFKKQGNTIKKGFHLILHPGLAFSRRNVSHDSVSTSGSSISPFVGGGAGLDIGINKNLTLTPFLVYVRYFSDEILKTVEISSPIHHESINLGVRIRIHEAKRKF